MKGIVFAGCSFTWGQGLYYYSGMDTLQEPPPNQYIPEYVTNAHKRYMFTKRFPRIVSNHFDTFEIVKDPNGGSEGESLNFLKCLFDSEFQMHHITQEKYSYSEIEYIIYQFTQPGRNRVKYDYKGEERYFNLIEVGSVNRDTHPFFEWLIKNDYTWESFMKQHTKSVFDEVKTRLIELESKGINIKLLCWENDYIPLITTDEWARFRFIPIVYKDFNYKSIRNLMEVNKQFQINSDYQNFDNPPQDHHPSLECHKLLGSLVIESIEDDIRRKEEFKNREII